MNNILIIGGNGFIGSNLSKNLLDKNKNVIIFDKRMPQKPIDGVKYIVGDFFDDFELSNAIQEINYVVHALSTINPSNSNDKYLMGYERDLIQTIKLCGMLAEKNIPMLFLSSGGTVYGNQAEQPIKENALPQPINHYGNVKLCIENVIKTFNFQKGTKFKIARMSNPYGPGQDFEKGVGFIDAAIKKTIQKETIEIWGDGSIIRDYIYIDDVCEMLSAIIDTNCLETVYNIGTGIGISQNQVIEILKSLGLQPKVKYMNSRSVDANKVILNNELIMKICQRNLVGIEEGIRLYCEYLR